MSTQLVSAQVEFKVCLSDANPGFISAADAIILFAMKEKSGKCPKYCIITNSGKETAIYQKQALKSSDPF